MQSYFNPHLYYCSRTPIYRAPDLPGKTLSANIPVNRGPTAQQVKTLSHRVKVELKKMSQERDEKEAEKEELSGRIEGLLSEKKQLSELLKETMSRLKEQVRTY